MTIWRAPRVWGEVAWQVHKQSWVGHCMASACSYLGLFSLDCRFKCSISALYKVALTAREHGWWGV